MGYNLSYKEVKGSLLNEETEDQIKTAMTADVVCNIFQDSMRTRLETFTLSANSREAIADLLAEQGAGWVEKALQYLRENQSIATMACVAVFLFLDFRKAIKEQIVINEAKELKEETEVNKMAEQVPPAPPPQRNIPEEPQNGNNLTVAVVEPRFTQ